MTVRQGDVYWVHMAAPDGTQPGYPHPYVVVRNAVVQDDENDHSRPDSVVVCAVTSNVKRAGWPGNVLLAAGEANLPRPSVVEVGKVFTVGPEQLGELIGSLDEARVRQILAGIALVERMRRDKA